MEKFKLWVMEHKLLTAGIVLVVLFMAFGDGAPDFDFGNPDK